MNNLCKHPKYGIFVSSDGLIVQNVETGYNYSIYETAKGYMRVEFRYKKHGLTRREKKLVHVLVAETFLEKESGQTDVDHIDRNRKNNDVSNLRWVTHKENMKNSSSYKHGRYALSK